MANGTFSALSDDGNGRSFLNADNGEGAAKIAVTLNILLADMFTLYFKTKNFHWHMTGPHFRDYHLLLDEQARNRSSPPPTPLPSASAKSAAARSDRSSTSPVWRGSPATTLISSHRA